MLTSILSSLGMRPNKSKNSLIGQNKDVEYKLVETLDKNNVNLVFVQKNNKNFG